MIPTASAAYQCALAAGECRIGEAEPVFGHMPELEWQARWFAGEFGREWISAEGEEIRMVDFGRWNREAGPDFVDARLRIGRREICGDIELDPDAQDWERHGHATNPDYRRVVLHVFLRRPERRFFTRTSDHAEVAQLHLSAGESPRMPHSDVTPFESSAALAILHTAARHRLDLKARSFRRHADANGEEEARFAALAIALGYKRNQTPFLLLAQRAGLAAASSSSGEAQLFGIAGFLEGPVPAAASRDVRAYLRTLWESWWSLRASCERLILPAKAWQFSSTRPANHPHRRVAALAGIAARWPGIRKALEVPDREALIAALESVDHPFWAARCNLRADKLGKPQALLGAERIRDILINIYHPLAVARDNAAWELFLAERGPASAAIIRQTVRKFFGDGHALPLSGAAVQQGLLQLERDYRSAREPAKFLAALRQLA